MKSDTMSIMGFDFEWMDVLNDPIDLLGLERSKAEHWSSPRKQWKNFRLIALDTKWGALGIH